MDAPQQDPRWRGRLIQLQAELGLLVEQAETATLESILVHLLTEFEGDQSIRFPFRVRQRLLERAALRRLPRERRVQTRTDVVHDPLDCLPRQGQSAEVGLQLLLEGGFGQTRIRARAVIRSPAAAVVHEALPGALGMHLRHKRPAAEAAAEHPGVCEGVTGRAGPTGSAEQGLCAFELVRCDHRLMRALVGLAVLQLDESHVVGVREQPKHILEGQGLAAEMGRLARAQAPVLFRCSADLHRLHPAREKLVPHLAHELKPLRVVDNGLRCPILEVPDRRAEVRPTLLEARAVATLDVCPQVIDELGGDAELKVAEKPVIPVGCVRALGCDHLRELLVSQRLEHLPGVEVIAGEAVHLPTENACDLALGDASHENAEHRPPWRLGGVGFGNHLVDREPTAQRQEFQLLYLGIDREDLPVVRFT